MKATSAQLVINVPPAAIPAFLRRLDRQQAPVQVNLEDCSPTAVAFFRALASNADGLTTGQIATALNVSARSLPPMIRAAKRAIADAGGTFDSCVARVTEYRKSKPHSKYQLTEKGRRWVKRLQG